MLQGGRLCHSLFSFPPPFTISYPSSNPVVSYHSFFLCHSLVFFLSHSCSLPLSFLVTFSFSCNRHLRVGRSGPFFCCVCAQLARYRIMLRSHRVARYCSRTVSVHRNRDHRTCNTLTWENTAQNSCNANKQTLACGWREDGKNREQIEVTKKPKSVRTSTYVCSPRYHFLLHIVTRMYTERLNITVSPSLSARNR